MNNVKESEVIKFIEDNPGATYREVSKKFNISEAHINLLFNRQTTHRKARINHYKITRSTLEEIKYFKDYKQRLFDYYLLYNYRVDPSYKSAVAAIPSELKKIDEHLKWLEELITVEDIV